MMLSTVRANLSAGWAPNTTSATVMGRVIFRVKLHHIANLNALDGDPAGMEPPEGLEPPTRSLQNCRSAN